MKNLMKMALLFASALVINFSFTACDDDDDDDGGSSSSSNLTEQEEFMQEITEQYLDDVVYETYEDLANSTTTLYTKITSLKTKIQAGTTITQSEIDDICDNYKEARNYWEESEAFLYGAATDYNIDPHIDTWPLDIETIRDVMASETNISKLDQDDNDAIEYANEALNVDGQLGFHGLEFIFFRDGESRDVSFFNNNEVESYEDYFTGYSITAEEEIIYAKAVAADLRDRTYQLEVAWAGDDAVSSHISRIEECQSEWGTELYGTTTNMGVSYGTALYGVDTDYYYVTSWRRVMSVILIDGCSNICAEVADQKMGQAYRCSTGTETEDDDPNYIESPYSYNSFNDFYDNIVSIQNVLYGDCDCSLGDYDDDSIMAYLAKYNSSEASELEDKLEAALDALQACKDSGTPFVKNPGSSLVGAAIEAVNDLDEELGIANTWILYN